MRQEVLPQNTKGGRAMVDDVRQKLSARTVANYATLVAEDRHLASEFAQLRAVGDTASALEVVHHAADGILDYCDNMLVVTPTGQSSSLLQTLRNIETVAKRCDQRGDEVQVLWCSLLHQTLAGSEWPPS